MVAEQNNQVKEEGNETEDVGHEVGEGQKTEEEAEDYALVTAVTSAEPAVTKGEDEEKNMKKKEEEAEEKGTLGGTGDGYDTYTFQDAVSSEPVHLPGIQKSASDQV